jgi:hypothetical protein
MYKAIDKITEPKNGQEPFQQPLNRSSMPMVAGILLIISGVLALLSWVSVITTAVSIIDISMLQEMDLTITLEQAQEMLVICGTIGCILAIFVILGGVLALKRKLWGMALAGGILGLFTIGPLFISSILALISIILVIISRKEFQ